MGCDYPFLECLREGIPRRLFKVWEVPLFGTILPLFGTLRYGVPRTGSKTPPVRDCSCSWLLWHDEKTTAHTETANGPDPPKRDQHTTELGSVFLLTMMRHDLSPGSCVTPMSWSRVAPSAPKFKNADTDTWRGQLCTSRVT